MVPSDFGNAVLSGCQASAGDNGLSDEAAHLAAGMLAAGYRCVEDSIAQKVADEFYEHLKRLRVGEGSHYFDGSSSTHALRHAIQELRQEIGDSDVALLAWVQPFAHFGYQLLHLSHFLGN